MDASSTSSHSAGSPRRKSNVIRIAASLLFSTAILSAQQAEVSMKLDIVAWGDAIGGLSLGTVSKEGNITALSFRYSKPVAYSGPALIEIHKNGDGDAKEKYEPSEEDLQHELMPLKPEETAADKDAPAKQGLVLELEKRRKKSPTLVSLAALPSACSRATVLLAPAADGTFIAYVIDDDPSRLPIGQLRIHNLSQYPVAMRLKDQPTKEIKTRQAVVVPVSNEQISYHLAYQLDGEWKFQEHNFMQVFAKDQTQMIILKSKNPFFLSADGSSGGFLQVVTLRRSTAP
jgi:hypothetical protein